MKSILFILLFASAAFAQTTVHGGTSVSKIVPDQTSNSGKFLTTDGTNTSWATVGGMSNPLTTTGDLIYSSSGSTPARLGIGSSNDVLTVVSGLPAWKSKAASQTSPASPTGTNSATGLMMGLAGSVTPTATGNVLLIVSGNITLNGGTPGDDATIRLRYGTGSAPTNGAALAGTATGTAASPVIDDAAMSSPVTVPFTIQSYVTGLTVSTAYWIDVSLATTSGATQTITSVVITVIEQ